MLVHQIYGIFNDGKDINEISDYREATRKTKKYCEDNGITYKMWNLEDCEKLIDEHFPHYKELWIKFRYPIQKADFIRYCILYHCGGIYLDCDVHPIREMRNLFNKDYFLVRWNDSHLPYNAIMGFKEGHPLLLDIMKECERSTNEKQNMERYDTWRGRLVFQTTGHFMIQRVLKRNKIPSSDLLNIVSVWNNVKNLMVFPENEGGIFMDSNSSQWYSAEEFKSSIKPNHRRRK
jgi:mannosyltransferase OCH1-like enzyme